MSLPWRLYKGHQIVSIGLSYYVETIYLYNTDIQRQFPTLAAARAAINLKILKERT